MNFDEIVDAEAIEYAKQVELNRHTIYIHVIFGVHLPSNAVFEIAKRFKNQFKMGGAEAVHNCTLRTKYTLGTHQLLALEFYNRVRDRVCAVRN